MFEDYRKATERANQILQAAAANERNVKIFLEDAEQWKSDARHAETDLAKEFGYVLRPRPTAKPLMVFNEAKFEEFWTRVHHNGERLPDHFFIDFKPLPLPDDFWLLRPAPKPEPAPTPNKPIGAKNATFGRGWFEHVGGPTFKPGDTWIDPDTDLEYKLVEHRESPFHPGFKPTLWGLVGVAKFPE